MKISIIVPIYNVSQYLSQCIESILNQTYKNLEIILVNDGSNDNSLEIIEYYQHIDDRIRVINKSNGGLSSARNIGIKEATGDYILHVDGDDWINRRAVEKLVDKALETGADIIIGDVNLYYQNKAPSVLWIDSTLKETDLISGCEYLENQFFKGKAKNCIWNKLINKSLYINYDISHPESISLGEDSSTLVRLLIHAKKVCKIKYIVTNYRQNENSMMNQKNKKILQYKQAIEICKEHFIKNNRIDLFLKYERIFKYQLFYIEVMCMTYYESKKMNYNDYIIGWEELKKEIRDITDDRALMNTLPKNKKIQIQIYNFNFYLGEIFTFIFRKIKFFKSNRLN